MKPKVYKAMYYLDHNATSPLRPEAGAVMAHALSIGGNPSSIHAAGRAAHVVIETAREQVAAIAGARARDVIFTSGGSEANALALCGAIYGALEVDKRITRLFVSSIEHDSVLANAHALTERVPGLRVEMLPVTANGVIDPEGVRVALREGKGRALVAAMAANNETGVVQPISEFRKYTLDGDALLLVDAVQAAGKMQLDIDADYITLSAHKLGGPQGVGALILKDDAPFAAQLLGGGQERGHRAGTQNVAGIAGFGAAAEKALTDIAQTDAIAVLRDRFEVGLKTMAAEALIFGEKTSRLPNTSNFALPGVSAENALMALDLDGVMISSGAACSSGKVRPSHVLAAMGVDDATARSALRVSLGWNSTQADIDAALASLTKIVARTTARAAA